MTTPTQLFFSCSGGNYISNTNAIKTQFPTMVQQIEQVEALCQQTGLEGEFRACLKKLPTGYYGSGQGPETLVANTEVVDLIFVIPRLIVPVMSCQSSGLKLAPIMRSRASARAALLTEITNLIHNRGFQINTNDLEHLIPNASSVTVGFQAELPLSAVTLR